MPGLQANLHITKEQVRLVLALPKLTYGVGQLINGQLAERVSPRRLLTARMLGSALLNVLFGSGTVLYFHRQCHPAPWLAHNAPGLVRLVLCRSHQCRVSLECTGRGGGTAQCVMGKLRTGAYPLQIADCG